MRISTLRADLLLLIAAVIWGSGFVAQRLGSEHLDAFAFTGLRFTLGTLLLLPLLKFASPPKHVAPVFSRRATQRGGLMAGIVMTLAATVQQHGLGSTSASNGAFITSLYVVFVPFVAIALTRHKIGWAVWAGVALAAVGLALLGLKSDSTINPGDWWILLCAALWAFHVVIVGIYSRDAEPIRMSLIQLGMTGGITLAIAFARGTLTAEAIEPAKWAVLYGAVLPVAVAFTLQVIAQRHAPPAHTALILSLESVFGMVAGIWFLSERPTAQQFAGAGLMLAGVVVSQVFQPKKAEVDTAESDTAEGSADAAAEES
jgi:drug/metabolite transporter (DMT)-like permease